MGYLSIPEYLQTRGDVPSSLIGTVCDAQDLKWQTKSNSEAGVPECDE